MSFGYGFLRVMPGSGTAGSHGSFIFLRNLCLILKLVSALHCFHSLNGYKNDFKETLELIPEITSTKACIQSPYFHIKHSLG